MPCYNNCRKKESYMDKSTKDLEKVLAKTKELLSHYIKDETKRKSFMDSNKPDNYIITNLDFKGIVGYNFNDGNNYLFKECKLDNVELYFKNDAIYFDNCVFSGRNIIHNQGIGMDDIVVLENIKYCNNLDSLTIKSSEVNVFDSTIDSVQNMLIVAAYCTFENCSLNAKQIVDINYLNECIIRNCNINRLSFSTRVINDLETVKSFIIVENSFVNGKAISGFDSGVHLMECIPIIKK